MNYLKNYFKSKGCGYYVAVASGVLSLVALVIYSSGFGADYPQFFSATPVWLPVIGIAGFIGLSVHRLTAPYAAAFMWICVFISLLLYVDAVYMYFPEVFYSGVNDETLAMLSPSFICGTLFYALAAITGNVAIWLRQLKKQTDGNSVEEEEPAV